MKPTYARYDMPAGQLEINRSEENVSLRVSGRFSGRFLGEKSTHFINGNDSELFAWVADIYEVLVGVRGTNSDVWEMAEEIRRFA
jgi:hypothetical protein